MLLQLAACFALPTWSTSLWYMTSLHGPSLSANGRIQSSRRSGAVSRTGVHLDEAPRGALAGLQPRRDSDVRERGAHDRVARQRRGRRLAGDGLQCRRIERRIRPRSQCLRRAGQSSGCSSRCRSMPGPGSTCGLRQGKGARVRAALRPPTEQGEAAIVSLEQGQQPSPPVAYPATSDRSLARHYRETSLGSPPGPGAGPPRRARSG